MSESTGFMVSMPARKKISLGPYLSKWPCYTAFMKNRKLVFIRAVRLLAPQDKLVFQFAMLAQEEDVPESPRCATVDLPPAQTRRRSRRLARNTPFPARPHRARSI